MAARNIQTLLNAEREAAASVQSAKESRVARMKAAKAEAAAEIEAYRQEQESSYQLSSSVDKAASDSQKLVKETKKDIETMKGQFNSNKKAVLDMMIHVAETVVTVVPEARKRGA